MSAETFVSLRVFAAEAALDQLRAAQAVGTPFQDARWLGGWFAAQGGAEALRLVEVQDEHGCWLLPVELTRLGGCRLARKIGGGHASLFAPLRLGAPRVLTRATLKAVARALDADALVLTDCPAQWEGVAPFEPGFPPAPDIARAAVLAPGVCEQLYTGEAGKKLRAKGRKLESLGTLESGFLQGAEAVGALDAMLAWKAAQFGLRGIDDAFENDAVRRFFQEGVEQGTLRLFALRLDARPVAVLVLAQAGGHASGMANGYDGAPEIARCGPGDVLIGRMIAALVAEGARGFDLGVGDARYKRLHCPEVMALNDVLVGASLKGAALVSAFALARALKARIKRNDGAFALLKRARARLLGRSGA